MTDAAAIGRDGQRRRFGTRGTVRTVRGRILIVDDDPAIAEELREGFRRAGYEALVAANAREMARELESARADLILLDIMLPDEDGFALLRRLRATDSTPVIFISGRSDLVDKVVGLELGGDDYIEKPFVMREVLARARSIMRRYDVPDEPVATERRVRRFAGWTLDLDGRELNAPDGRAVPLTTAEYNLLAALVERPQRVLTRDYLSDLLSGQEWSPMDRRVDVRVGRVRQKLREGARNPHIIKSVRNAGYILTVPVEP